mgnify:CR=1 FL=1
MVKTGLSPIWLSNESQLKKITKFIYNNRKFFAGISLIPQSGDKDYPQAPFTTVYTSREIAKEYGDAALWCSGLIELGLNAFDNNLWSACDYITLNQETDQDGEDKKLFSLKMKRFSKKYDPSLLDKQLSITRSGWGIIPKIFLLSFNIPAIFFNDPFGLESWFIDPFSSQYLKGIKFWSSNSFKWSFWVK